MWLGQHANPAKLQDYQKTFSSDHGRRVLYDLAVTLMDSMPSNFANDPMVLASREGERGVCLRILKLLKTDIEQAMKLAEKAHEHVSSKNII